MTETFFFSVLSAGWWILLKLRFGWGFCPSHVWQAMLIYCLLLERCNWRIEGSTPYLQLSINRFFLYQQMYTLMNAPSIFFLLLFVQTAVFPLHTAIVVIFQHDDKRGTGCEDVRNMFSVFRHCTVYPHTQRNTQRQSISIWNENEPCNEKSEGECTSRKKLSVNWKHGGLMVDLCFPLARPLFFC